MGKFHVVEQFISINGEGKKAGQLAYFIRFAGCNLNCHYCDTKWANEPDVLYEIYDEKQLYQRIKDSGVKNITITGEEPLLQKGMEELLNVLQQDKELSIEIETNGSIDIRPFRLEGISFTLDYKLSVSGMESEMFLENYQNIKKEDTVKFVVGSKADMQRSKEIIEQYQLQKKGCGIYLSPCFGKITPAEMVDFLIENRMNDVNIQLQLHKYIWDPARRGV